MYLSYLNWGVSLPSYISPMLNRHAPCLVLSLIGLLNGLSAVSSFHYYGYSIVHTQPFRFLQQRYLVLKEEINPTTFREVPLRNVMILTVVYEKVDSVSEPAFLDSLLISGGLERNKAICIPNLELHRVFKSRPPESSAMGEIILLSNTTGSI